MSTHDPLQPDHGIARARRHQWAARLLWITCLPVILIGLVRPTGVIFWGLCVLTALPLVAAALLLIPWHTFGQPDDVLDTDDPDDPEQAVYPS